MRAAVDGFWHGTILMMGFWYLLIQAAWKMWD